MISIGADSNINCVIFNCIDGGLAAHADIFFLRHAPPAAFAEVFIQLLICQEMVMRFTWKIFYIFFTLSLFLFAPGFD